MRTQPDEPLEPDERVLVPPKQRPERASKCLRRVLLGTPLQTDRLSHTLLPKVLALPVYASDAISSCAYATQEIMLVLGAAGLGSVAFASTYRNFGVYTVLGIVLLLAIVAVSYWQTIFTYPSGGGSYSVTSDNLGTRWHALLHGNSGLLLRLALLSRRDVVLVNFRYELEAGHEQEAMEWERSEHSETSNSVHGVQ